MSETTPEIANRAFPRVLLICLIAGAVIVITIGGIFYYRNYQKHARHADFLETRVRLREIGMGLCIYEFDHGKHLPDNLQSLVPDYLSAEVLISPLSGQEFAYIKGLSFDFDMTPETVIVYDRLVQMHGPEYDKNRFVLFLDGHTDWMTEDELDLE